MITSFLQLPYSKKFDHDSDEDDLMVLLGS